MSDEGASYDPARAGTEATWQHRRASRRAVHAFDEEHRRLFEHAADDQARFGPGAPAELVPLLTRFARCTEPPIVVDLGCGTGLSTWAWLGHARQVIGVDRSGPMPEQARQASRDVHRKCCDTTWTGLPSGSADIVVAVQSVDWREPRATLTEVARLLRPGGVFAAVDTALPPAIDPELDVLFEEFMVRASQRLRGDALRDESQRWDEREQLQQMRESGLFRHTRAIELHSIERGDARRLLGLARTAVDMAKLREAGVSDQQLSLDALGAVATRIMGERDHDWVFGFRVRIAVK
jgi:SAM-dependent methyltransferase